MKSSKLNELLGSRFTEKDVFEVAGSGAIGLIAALVFFYGRELSAFLL